MSITTTTYTKLRRAVRKEMEAGRLTLERAYRRQVLVTHWNIGKLIHGVMPDDKPSEANAAVMKRLSKDFERPESFFYALAKFYRYYPRIPDTDLSWTHYLLLLGVDDPKERLAFEQKVIDQGINVKTLAAMLAQPAQHRVLRSGFGQLKFERGRLYHYKAVRNARFPVGKGRVLVDIGFGIEKEVPLAKGSKIHTGHIVRAVKEDGEYSVRISEPEKSRLYTYTAFCERVIDGDTILARIDLGFRTWITQRLRLRGIDCPERSNALGEKARLFTRDRLTRYSKTFVVKTYKDDKYGRFLADVFYHKAKGAKGKAESVEDIVESGIFLNQLLLDKGLAVLWKG